MAGKQGRRGWGRIRRLPSKRWQASYVGPDLARHTAPSTFSTKMDAERWLSDEQRLIERNEWSPPSARAAVNRSKAMTVAQYASTWLAERDLKHRTRVHYAALLKNHIAPSALGSTAVKGLTAATVRTWHAGLDPTHKTARAHAYSLLHAICEEAVVDTLMESNPCTAAAMSAPTQRQPVILTVEEVGRLADAVRPELKALVLVSAWCGLRWGEVIELRRKDIGRDAAVISVARAATHQGGCKVDTPKNGKPREVIVPRHIRGDVLSHLEKFVADTAGAQLFPAARGGCHLNDSVFRKQLRPALKSIGQEGVRIHDLRHFAGTAVASVGTLAETMHHLGHSTVKAAMRYQHIAKGRPAEIAEALSEMAEGPS